MKREKKKQNNVEYQNETRKDKKDKGTNHKIKKKVTQFHLFIAGA